MSTISENAKAIFLEAVEKHSPEGWPKFLDQACGDDRDLRGRVEGLLQAHADKDSLFDRVEATRDYEPLVRPGQMIGPYKIREQIGDGGMGVVYVAEQEKPLRRKVALKVIKPGMDSEAVLARFEAERNALALMDHPNIAKVLDAGATDQGRPYFVMELVSGIPITGYCDEHQLSIRDRLSLFTQVCLAIQHAHQKAVIHRDIKPTNVLVAEVDGKPIPKVIDFGVAKALNQSLTERSIYTSFQSVVGTPLYMSPEQASLSNVDVDTRSDVYSLGILLYELLTGSTPLSLDDLKQAAQEEILKQVREKDPPRPSNRISTLGEISVRVSRCRGTQPEQLGRLVCGDLDWIVMKALEKDRSRRYRTADAFAEDVVRHMANEPVEARPPSTAYRVSRFYKRNKLLVGTLAFVVALLAIAVPITSFGWLKAAQETQEKQRALADAEALAFEVAMHVALLGVDDQSSDAFAIIAHSDDPQMRLTVEGLAAYTKADFWKASERFVDVLEADPSDNVVRAFLASASIRAGRDELYAQHLQLLRHWQPETDLERLALAAAMMHDDPSRSRQLIASANEHPYFVKLQLLGEAKLLDAIREGDLDSCREALNTFRNTEVVLGPNRNVRMMKLIALLFASKFALRDGADEHLQDLVQQLDEVGTDMARDPRDAGDRYTCWLYLLEAGDLPKAREMIKGIRPEDGSYVMMLAMDRLLQAEDVGEAAVDFAEVIGSNDFEQNDWAAIAKAHLSWGDESLDDPCWAHVARVLASPTKPLMLRRHALYAWSLRGDLDDVRKKAKAILNDVDEETANGSREFLGAIKMLTGDPDLRPDKLLERAGQLGGDVHRAHFAIAMENMALRRTDLALQHFQKAADSKWLDFDESLARAYAVYLSRRLNRQQIPPATVLPGATIATWKRTSKN